MSDYISKEYITEHIKACWINGRPKHATELHEVLSWIDEVPPEDVQPVQWIPCSKRLPDEDVEVLVTDDAGGMVTIDVDRWGRYEDTGERFWYASQHVTAWMPLPEPYQEGEQDE